MYFAWNLCGRNFPIFFLVNPRKFTLKEETFAGTKFRGFAVGKSISQKFIPLNFSEYVTSES